MRIYTDPSIVRIADIGGRYRSIVRLYYDNLQSQGNYKVQGNVNYSVTINDTVR